MQRSNPPELMAVTMHCVYWSRLTRPNGVLIKSIWAGIFRLVMLWTSRKCLMTSSGTSHCWPSISSEPHLLGR